MHRKRRSFASLHWYLVIAQALTLLAAPEIPSSETNRYAKVAEQVVKLINTGDYSAIETTLFNEAMGRALPLEKATEFFTGLTGKFGTIQKLDAPVSSGGWTVWFTHFQHGDLDMSMALDRGDKIAGIKFTPHVTKKPGPEQTQASHETERYTNMANRLADLINAGDYACVQTNFNQEMDAAMPLERSSAFFTQLTQRVGKIQEVGEPKPIGAGMVFPTKCERGALDMQLALDNHGLIAGLRFIASASTSDEAAVKHQAELSLPFKGSWLVFWGGDTRELNQHHDTPAQRFAFDFCGVDETGKRYRVDGAKNEDYFCFGRAIYAPAEGVILEAIDGVRDNQPGVMNPYCLVGNCVVIQHRTNEVSVLAHLQRGSVAVKAGDHVKRGQVLGLCGNSGNSSEPHLHYQLQDSPVFQGALGIKVLFVKVVTKNDGKSETKIRYSPVKGDVISPGE